MTIGRGGGNFIAGTISPKDLGNFIVRTHVNNSQITQPVRKIIISAFNLGFIFFSMLKINLYKCYLNFIIKSERYK